MKRLATLTAGLGMLLALGVFSSGCTTGGGTTTGSGGSSGSGSGGTTGGSGSGGDSGGSASGGTTGGSGSGGDSTTGGTSSGGSSGSASGGSSGSGTGGDSGSSSGGSSGSGTGGDSGGGTGGAGGDTSTLPICVGVKNKATCTDEPPCNNTCGPEKTGLKTCTCVAGAWDCPTCTFPDGNDYSCYKLPDPLMPCPADPTDPTGGNLPQSGGTCTQAMCMACGSATDPTYRDSSNAAKIGYCICNVNMKYACASTSEWPPQ